MAASSSRGDDLRALFYFRFYFVSFLFCIFVENIKISAFSDICNPQMAHFIEIFPIYITYSITLLLMTWRRRVPEKQQPWYWPTHPGIFQFQSHGAMVYVKTVRGIAHRYSAKHKID